MLVLIYFKEIVKMNNLTNYELIKSIGKNKSLHTLLAMSQRNVLLTYTYNYIYKYNPHLFRNIVTPLCRSAIGSELRNAALNYVTAGKFT